MSKDGLPKREKALIACLQCRKRKLKCLRPPESERCQRCIAEVKICLYQTTAGEPVNSRRASIMGSDATDIEAPSGETVIESTQPGTSSTLHDDGEVGSGDGASGDSPTTTIDTLGPQDGNQGDAFEAWATTGGIPGCPCNGYYRCLEHNLEGMPVGPFPEELLEQVRPPTEGEE